MADISIWPEFPTTHHIHGIPFYGTSGEAREIIKRLAANPVMREWMALRARAAASNQDEFASVYTDVGMAVEAATITTIEAVERERPKGATP